MKPLTTHIAGWLLVGLTVLPLIAADAGQEREAASTERLQWLLTSHDVRYAIHAPSSASGDCEGSKTESGR